MNESQILVKIDDKICVCDIWYYLGNGKYGITIHKDYYSPGVERFLSYQIIDEEVLEEISLDSDEIFQLFEVEI